MQRVRIGLTGLACVFLLVLLGAIFVRFVRAGEASRETDIAVAASSSAGVAANNATEAPREPLAELGITPGNAPIPPDAAANTSHGATPAP
jgi:hypothetical protein